MLIGRDREQRSIASLLEGARSNGSSAALVIRGEPGIGKTALLEDAGASCGMRTLRCSGVESEHDLAFAGLEQLFRPVRGLIDRLPDPQAEALRSAFGLSTARVEGRLLPGLATLGLLSEASEDAPLLCLVDDLHWLDGSSTQALLFAARRLGAEGVVMLFAVRDDPARWFEAPGLPELTVAPLPDPAAREVLSTLRDGRMDTSAQRRLLREAGGNPLALLELPARSAGLDATGVEATYRARVVTLPPDTRRLLLIAAAGDAEQAGTWPELEGLAGLPPEAHQAAADAGLIAGAEIVVWRHPLARSAVYGASSPGERADAHRLLAAAATDPLSRASHLAAVAHDADETLAAELEAAAAAVAARGGFAPAAAAFARASDLSTDPGGRARRLIAAAQAHLDAGDAEAASTLAEEALVTASTAADHAGLAAVRGALEIQRGIPGTAYEVLLGAAHTVAGSDPARALELQAQAILASFVAGWPERGFAEAHSFLGGLPPTDSPYERALRVFLDAVAASGAAAEARARLLEAVRLGTAAEEFRLVVWAGLASAYLGDMAIARELCMRATATARAAGSFSTLPMALLGRARLGVNTRAFDEAEESAQEGIELTRQLEQENLETCFSAMLVRCLAARGRIEACRELANATLQRALAHGIAVAAADVHLGLAELELSLGHGAAARDMIEAVSHALFRLAAAPYLVEASLMTGADGDIDAGVPAALDAFAGYAEQARDPQMLGLLARSRALLAGPAERAEPLFLEALRHQTEHAQPFERARTALAYGAFLRRAQRRSEARVQLRDALATFEGLDTPLWADRARAELEATGVTARKRDPSTLDSLTPQELRIAKLVAAGASNRDVAGQLFLSPKTVEYHLRKVFLKLGVSSRVELARLPLQPGATG
jgi:DNA-binding CsgD family transcriptional regulator/tetratricopeptide (TPR) repeat protein